MRSESEKNIETQDFIDDPYVQRVAQLDASELDDELYMLFKDQVGKTFKYVKFSLTNHHATVGQRLLNIKFRNRSPANAPSQTQLMLFVGGLVGTHWIKSREAHLTLWCSRWPKIKKIVSWSLNWSDVGIRMVILANLLLFLVEGKYSAPLERILRLRPVPASRQNIRQVSYEYLNRELLWHGFAEFVAFFLPLMNIRRLLNAVCRYIPLEFVEPTSESQRTFEDFQKCLICDLSPTSPHGIGCRHVFCYYCLTSSLQNDPNFRCPECGLQIRMHSSPRPVKM